jgi:hypothetical protein
MKWKRVLALVLVFTVSVLQVTAQDASPQTNKQAIRSALAELSAGNPKAVVDLYSVVRKPPEMKVSRSFWKPTPTQSLTFR